MRRSEQRIRMQQFVRPVGQEHGALGMKASGIGKEAIAGGHKDATVCIQDDYAASQSESGVIGTALNHVSAKAFKGKGTHWALRQVTRKLENVECAMRELRSLCRDVHGKELYLNVLVYRRDGRVLLRWGWVDPKTGRWTCLRYERAQKIWGKYAEPARSWYAQVGQYAQSLNQQHRELMHEKRNLQRQMSIMPVLPHMAVRNPGAHDQVEVSMSALKQLDAMLKSTSAV